MSNTVPKGLPQDMPGGPTDTIVKLAGTIVLAGFRPPALLIGLAGLIVVGLVLVWEPLASFATAWYVPALLSLAAWLAMASTQVDSAVYRRLRAGLANSDPYLARALERRDALAAQVELLTIDSVRADASAMLQRIDRELLPELQMRIRRHRTLLDALGHLAQGRGSLVGASPESIASLRQLAKDQQEALDGVLNRLSDMNASLMGLAQESDEGQLAEQARQWAEELASYWQATAEVFRPARAAQ